MKNIILLLLSIMIVITLLPVTVYADIGPKPSVVIDFKGLDEKTYYVTLLSKTESTGPYYSLKYSNKDHAHYHEGDKDYDIFLKLLEYEDIDGFYFLQFFQDCSLTQRFSWTYYPPQEFKILLYLPETNTFIVSDEKYKQYAFDSYFTANVSEMNLSGIAQSEVELVIKKSYDYTDEILSLIVRILLTILIELGIALLFGFREKKQFKFIVLVNIVTQIVLNLALNIINYQSGQMAFIIFYVLLEILICIIEVILYSAYLKKYSKKATPYWKPPVYALVANASSFVLGLGLAYWIPGIF